MRDRGSIRSAHEKITLRYRQATLHQRNRAFPTTTTSFWTISLRHRISCRLTLTPILVLADGHAHQLIAECRSQPPSIPLDLDPWLLTIESLTSQGRAAMIHRVRSLYGYLLRTTILSKTGWTSFPRCYRKISCFLPGTLSCGFWKDI